MKAKEAENLAVVDQMFADEGARQEAVGLDKAENTAAIAICAYPCRTAGEARIKVEYLRDAPSLSDGLAPPPAP